MRIRKWAIWVIATIMLISFLISVVFLPYVPFKNKFLENKDTGILIGKTQSVLIIENYTIIKTDTVINKSILIRGNGTLDLRANLTINSTFKYEHNITIQNNGTLLLNSGAINSTNWTCIYTYHNSSVLLRNHSKIELKNIILNASGILKINDSYMNANLMGYISEILLIESLVNISNSNNLTSLFNIICESLFGINSNVLISGENNVFNVSAKNITLFSMNFRTDNGIDMSGANSTIFLNATEFCNLTYSIFKIYGGNSTNGNNGGNSKIIVKGYGIYIQNTSILGQQGVNKKTSENGSSIILINARQILFINESDFYSLIGNITLNSSEIIIKKSEFRAEDYPELRIKLERIKNDSIRIIEIENFDWSACSGTHVNSTKEIGNLLVTRYNKKRELYEIHYTVEPFNKLYDYAEIIRKLSDALEIDDGHIYRYIINLNKSAKEMKEKLRSAGKEILNNLEKIADNAYFKETKDIDSKIIQKEIFLIFF